MTPRAAPRRLAALLAAGLAAACSIGPKPAAAPAAWDFGPPADAAPRVRVKSLAAIEVTAPRWIDTVGTHYRLAYANAAQPMAYAHTRWVMPPPALLEARLRERLVAGGALLGGAGPTLQLDLDEFAQVFDSEKASRAVVRARATLKAGREVLRQQRFVVDLPAASPDGPGGAAALARAADRLVDTVLDWAGGP
ncbi:MAG: membrane integrity-associated transporter subunit PqiC [Burkholderiales bacterium]|nr:membrane integrity-associated transporter subunit PqiC [Burkholderiales bacterium]